MKGKRRSAPCDSTGLLAYLETASDRGVGQIQLNKLNEAANIRSRILADLQEWVRASAEVLYMDWVMKRRQDARLEALTVVPEGEPA